MTDPVGEVPILITGDYSDVQADFDAAVQIATTGAGELQDAIQSSVAAPDVAPVTDAFNELGSSVDSVSTENLPALDQAMASTTASAQETGAAVHNAAVEAENAESPFQSLAEKIAGMAESAHEGTGSITELVSSFGELAEIGVAGFAIGELGKEAIDAAGSMDKATISLTALTGGSEQAAEMISQLEEVANQDALSFPAVLVAAQRMTAFLGADAAGQIPELMSSIADGAAAANSSIDAAASAFDRIVSGGTLMARSLMPLGLSLQAVSDAMGVTADEALKAFKALDQQERIDVLTAALGRFQGISQQIAGTVPGQWTIIGNQLHTIFVDLGNVIGPILTPILQGLGFVLDSVGKAASGFGAIWKIFTGGANDATGAATENAAAVSKMSDAHHQATDTATALAAATKDAAAATGTVAPAAKTSADAVTHLSSIVFDAQSGFYKLSDAQNATSQSSSSASESVDSFSSIMEASASATDLATTKSEDHKVALEAQSAALDRANADFDAAVNLSAEYGDAMDSATQADDSFSSSLGNVGESFDSIGSKGKTFSMTLADTMDEADSSASALTGTITGDLTSGLNGLIDGTKSVGSSFEKMGLDAAKSIADQIIKGGIEPLLSSLGDVQSVVGDIFGSMDGGGGGGGGLFGSILGGMSGLLSGLGGFAGGIAGTLVEAFGGSHQDTLLSRIEENTRYLNIEYQQNSPHMWTDAVVTDLDDIKSHIWQIAGASGGAIGSSAGGGFLSVTTATSNGSVSISAPITIQGGASNAADIAREVANYLMSISPRFAVSF